MSVGDGNPCERIACSRTHGFIVGCISGKRRSAATTGSRALAEIGRQVAC